MISKKLDPSPVIVKEVILLSPISEIVILPIAVPLVALSLTDVVYATITGISSFVKSVILIVIVASFESPLLLVAIALKS